MINHGQPNMNIERKEQQLQSLIQIGQILHSAATLPEDELLQLIYEQVAKLMDATNFYVAIYDAVQSTVSFGLAYEDGARQPIESDWAPRKLRRGLTEWIIENKEPLLLYRESEIDDWVRKNERERIGRHAKCWLGVPMFARDKTLGVMAVQSYAQEDLYDEKDRDVLQTIAAQAAIAIDNARLLEGERRRNHELDGLLEVGQAITQSTLSLRQVLQRIVENIPKIIRCDYALVFPFNEQKHEFDFEHIATYGISPDVTFRRSPRPEGIVAEVLRQGTLKVTDTSDSTLTFISRGIDSGIIRLGVKSLLGVRLDVAAETVGVMFVDFASPRQFTDDEFRTVQVYGHQAAIAIQNARLFEEEVEKRVRDIEAIREIDMAIGKEPLEKILDIILKRGAELINAKHGSLKLVDPASADLVVKATLGPDWTEELRSKRLRIGVGVTGHAVETRMPQRIGNVDQEYRYQQWFPDVKSEMAIPLLRNGGCIGVINFDGDEYNAFTSTDQRLVESLAAQTVVAIRLTEQYAQLEHAREELEALRNVDKAIIESVKVSHDLDELLQFILEEAMKVTKSWFGNVMWYDPSEDTLVMRAMKGVALEYKGARQRIGEGVVGRAAKIQKTVLVNDIKALESGMTYLGWIPGMRSELAAPILDDSSLLAVINVEHPQPNVYSEDDLRLVEALAQQAVIAIQNIQRIADLEAIRRVVQDIVSTLDLQKILDLILDKSLELTHAQIGGVRLIDKQTNELVVRAVHAPEGIAVNEKWTRIPADSERGITAAVFRNKLPVLVKDTHLDPRYVEFWKGTRSEVDVPLVRGNRAIGVLSLESRRVAAFNENHQKVLQSLADLAVIAIQNAERYEQQKTTERLAMLGAVSANLAHRMGNDVGTIPDSARRAKKLLPARFKNRQGVVRYLDRIESDAQALVDTAEKLRRPYKPEQSELVDVNLLVEETLTRAIIPSTISVKLQLQEGSLKGKADSTFLVDTFKNVIDNAIEAMNKEGTLTIRSSISNEGDAPRVLIEFSDTGPGIAPQDIERVFDIFFTRKKGKGMGFGLWWCRMFLNEIRGEIKAFSEPGQGATFRIYLPLQ